MLDDLRQQDWVPRSVRDRSNQIAKAKALITKLNREPSQDELPNFVYVSCGFSTLYKESRCSCPLSTEDTIGENLRIGDVIPDNNIDALDSEQETQMKNILMMQSNNSSRESKLSSNSTILKITLVSKSQWN